MSRQQQRTVIIGIDPSSGAVSQIGVSAFDADTNEILLATSFAVPRAQQDSLHHRVIYIHDKVKELIEDCVEESLATFAYAESTVMRGASGESLARATGAILCAIPHKCEFEFVHNSTVKKLVAGSGKAEKSEVARGVLAWFSDTPESDNKVSLLIKNKDWDAIDALAIGIAGLLRETQRG